MTDAELNSMFPKLTECHLVTAIDTCHKAGAVAAADALSKHIARIQYENDFLTARVAELEKRGAEMVLSERVACSKVARNAEPAIEGGLLTMDKLYVQGVKEGCEVAANCIIARSNPPAQSEIGVRALQRK